MLVCFFFMCFGLL
uniref:Uncharacterized protein n=1 Tax=Anguilla anguilla TaxID=7936 RepID=A0A0E9W5H6_ANGAN